MRTVSLFAIALVVLVGLGATEATAQSSAWGSSNGVLVFRSDRDGEPDLFTVDASGSGAENLTPASGAAELQPAWSPAGDRIAYVRRAGITGRADLFVVNASGGGRTRLTSTPVPERILRGRRTERRSSTRPERNPASPSGSSSPRRTARVANN